MYFDAFTIIYRIYSCIIIEAKSTRIVIIEVAALLPIEVSDHLR